MFSTLFFFFRVIYLPAAYGQANQIVDQPGNSGSSAS